MPICRAAAASIKEKAAVADETEPTNPTNQRDEVGHWITSWERASVVTLYDTSSDLTNEVRL